MVKLFTKRVKAMSELPENLEHFTTEVKGSVSMLEDLYLRRLRDPENEFLRD